MGRISARQIERSTKPVTDWKDSRLVVAALSVAGTATFMSTVVMPITNASLNAKIEALLPAAAKVASLERELSATKARLEEAQTVAKLATMQTPFLPGSVYPVHLDRVAIGATPELVLSVYPNAEWDEDKRYLSVRVEMDHFASVTYFFEGKFGAQRVSSIIFHPAIDSGWDRSRLTERFTVLFGPPAFTASKGRALWRATPREAIELNGLPGDGTYSVRRWDYKPAWVP